MFFCINLQNLFDIQNFSNNNNCDENHYYYCYDLFMLLASDLDNGRKNNYKMYVSIIIIIPCTYTDLPSLVPSDVCSTESPTSSVDAEALLNWMALLCGDIGVSRRNFIANHFPRNCRHNKRTDKQNNTVAVK